MRKTRTALRSHGVFRGAEWHEREAMEMYGIDFDGHPRLVNLYLPEDFEGHPGLRSLQAADPHASRSGRGPRTPKRPRREGTRWRSQRTNVQRRVAELVEELAKGNLATQEMILNVGPQHPATHGVFRLLATIDGEKLIDAEPIIGYMHRGYEKLVEAARLPADHATSCRGWTGFRASRTNCRLRSPSRN